MAQIERHTLTNIGNTCFMNSVFQLLYSINELRDELNISQLCNEPLVKKTLRDLFKQMKFRQKGHIVSRDNMKKYLENIRCDFQQHQQDDASSYLTLLVDKYITEVGDSSSFVKSIRFNENDTLFCKYSKIPPKTSIRTEFKLELPIIEGNKSTSLQDLIINYQEKEVFKNYLETCAANDNTDVILQNSRRGLAKEKQIIISCTNNTNYIIISLKRFGKNGASMEKLVNIVTVNKEITICNKVFAIVGCIMHVKGTTLKGGHYVYHLYNDKGEAETEYDDEVRKDGQSNFEFKDQEKNNGYIFLYKLVNKAAPAAPAPAASLAADPAAASLAPAAPLAPAAAPPKRAPLKSAGIKSKLDPNSSFQPLQETQVFKTDVGHKTGVFKTQLLGFEIYFCIGKLIKLNKDDKNKLRYYYVYLLRKAEDNSFKIVLPLGIYEFLKNDEDTKTTIVEPSMWGKKFKDGEDDKVYPSEFIFFPYVNQGKLKELLPLPRKNTESIVISSGGSSEKHWFHKMLQTPEYVIKEFNEFSHVHNNSFFEALVMALTHDNPNINVTLLRKTVATHIPKKWFEYMTDLYTAAEKSVLYFTAEQQKIQAEFNTEKEKLTAHTLQQLPSRSQLDHLKDKYETKFDKITMCKKTVKMYQKFFNQSHSKKTDKESPTFATFKPFVESTDYIPDDMAISVLEGIYHCKLILLHEEVSALSEAVHCAYSFRSDATRVPPRKYIIMKVSKDRHYALITYLGRTVFSRTELPEAIKDAALKQYGFQYASLLPESQPLVSRRVQRLLSLQNDLTCNVELCRDEVVLQYCIQSADASVGLGAPSEYLSPTSMQEYLPLALNNNWRQTLSTAWKVTVPFKVDNDETLWYSVDDYFLAQEEEAATTNDSKDIGLDIFYTKKGKDGLTAADIAIRKGLTAKFNSNDTLRHVLLSTKDAKLMTLLPNSQGLVMDIDLMTVRNCLAGEHKI